MRKKTAVLIDMGRLSSYDVIFLKGMTDQYGQQIKSIAEVLTPFTLFLSSSLLLAQSYVSTLFTGHMSVGSSAFGCLSVGRALPGQLKFKILVS